MSKQILVPLKPHDRIHEVLPGVERVAQPGMQVVFLLRYPVDGFTRHLGLYRQLEGGLSQRTAAVRQLANIYTWEGNMERAKRKVSPAREALEPRGVEVAVEAYTGSLRKFVRSYTAKNEVHLIVTLAGMGSRVARILGGMIPVTQWFKKPSFSPVLLINPRTLV